ncbi:MAG: hypothetical protein M1831_005838 [Alyxoria varia]|nr:MAG: hypothetical protein M1831_005838 [Alyxoria varia]
MPDPPQPSTQPTLNPQFCTNTTALRDFLRLSRATIDDPISAHLNALLQPSRSNPFNPATTSARGLDSPLATGRQSIPGSTCAHFKREVLYPSWRARDLVLAYCGEVATAVGSLPGEEGSNIRAGPNPRAGDDTARNPPRLGSTSPEADAASPVPEDSSRRKILRNPWGKEQVPDERTDPYSNRDYSYTRTSEAQVLTRVLADEEGVERIVRSRTWGLLGERCLGGAGAGGIMGWEKDYKDWREGQTDR